MTPAEQNHLLEQVQVLIGDAVKALKQLHGEMARPVIAASAYQKQVEGIAKGLRQPFEMLNRLRVTEPAPPALVLDPLTEVVIASERRADLDGEA